MYIYIYSMHNLFHDVFQHRKSSDDSWVKYKNYRILKQRINVQIKSSLINHQKISPGWPKSSLAR